MKKIFALLSLAVLLTVSYETDACTSAIFTGKATPDGRPLMWKNRDTGELRNIINYIPSSKDVKYAFLELANFDTPTEAWAGTNEMGFSIMNTASYNLKEDKSDAADLEGEVMYQALASCRNLADFEKYLSKRKRPMGVEANFGVIDAEGGAAYYEVNNTSWRKIDANDQMIAPQGYLVYTNYSYTGRMDEGSGYERFTTASEIVLNRVGSGRGITPQWIINDLSREFYHSILGIDLRKDADKVAPNGWFVDQDFIPRRSTSAAIVFKGVKKGESPLLTTMWSVLGYAPVSVAVPLFVAAGADQPWFVKSTSESDLTCKICSVALERRAKVFSLRRGNGKNYFRFSLLQNNEGTGYMQILKPYEDRIFAAFNPVIEGWYKEGAVDVDELQKLYQTLDWALDVK